MYTPCWSLPGRRSAPYTVRQSTIGQVGEGESRSAAETAQGRPRIRQLWRSSFEAQSPPPWALCFNATDGPAATDRRRPPVRRKAPTLASRTAGQPMPPSAATSQGRGGAMAVAGIDFDLRRGEAGRVGLLPNTRVS